MEGTVRALRFLLFSIWLQKPWRFLLDLLWDEGMSFVDWSRHLATIKAKGLFLSGLRCERRVYIASGVDIALPSQQCIYIGAESFVGRNGYFGNHARIDIGEGCLIGSHIKIITATHDPRTFSFVTKPVSIGPFSWIGTNVTVLPGVSIGKGCIIGANSLVTRDIPDYTIAYGVPCRVQYRRDLPVTQQTAIGRQVVIDE